MSSHFQLLQPSTYLPTYTFHVTIGLCFTSIGIWAILVVRFTLLHAVPLLAPIAGLPLYSYRILVHLLREHTRAANKLAFFASIAIAIVIRTIIIAFRATDSISNSSFLRKPISYLHINYFTSIAVIKGYSSFLQIHLLGKVYNSSPIVLSNQIRLSTLGIAFVTRTITYAFRTIELHAVGIPDQVNHFAYILVKTINGQPLT
ncbi:hypothetical protein BDV23DRAFT_171874 [Aspergillus alliaceus]|uniref:Uncharacterized protein n=1 Tax=Petromyces alliaceus TaxID=209559 RepID=A0A5N7CAE6_PETAA|nr:hypothetical protein BDV23DRAFT_171874 [Aspergillus alliaceus]